MFSKIRSRMQSEGGFTLIELLVVIIIIAILAAIAIPTFLGQRQKAHDAAGKSLVRNAMTAVESSYVDAKTFDATIITPTVVGAIEPSITWNADNGFDAAAEGTLEGVTALAAVADVVYGGDADSYSIGSKSASGNFFGVVSLKSAGGGTVFYKSIDGVFSSAW